MESKWFTEIPEKLDEDWIAMVCPVGKRCLVMAIDVSQCSVLFP